MSRPFTVTILKPDGSAWNGGKFTISLREGFAGVDEAVSSYTIEYTLDTNGQIATQPIALETPPTGTAHYLFGEPGGESTEAYIETGAAVDYSTLKTVASAAVDQDAAQDLFDQSQVFAITNATTTYAVQATDEYIRCSGTFTVTAPAATGSGRVVAFKNVGSGNITLTPDGADTIDGYSSIILPPLAGLSIIDAASWRWDIHGA